MPKYSVTWSVVQDDGVGPNEIYLLGTGFVDYTDAKLAFNLLDKYGKPGIIQIEAFMYPVLSNTAAETNFNTSLDQNPPFAVARNVDQEKEDVKWA